VTTAERPAASSRRPVIITGGGTGGHTSPGLAVAAALRARDIPCVWIGSRSGLEARRAPEAGIPYHAIPTGKLRRALAWQNVPDVAVNVPAGVLKAWTLLRRLQPRAVFATGGFVALPVALATALARVPLVVHEQTAVPGVANRLAARVARRVAVTFAESARWFRGDLTVVTGNPLRPELRHGERGAAAQRFGLDPALPLVYVTGGAQGAHAINRAVGEALESLLRHANVLHQSGDNPRTGDRAWLEARRAALPAELAARYVVRPWIGDELADIYAAVALVVARAGAGTVNECCQLGVPALYIPLPDAAGDEQTANARLVGRVGGCAIVPQATMTPALLVERIHGLLTEPARLKEMGERARALAVPDAADRLVEVLLEVAR
jgi:UDP-N-acetylglucosamine--N-acetylmuramyl-(pentapeptide) pyrophosphoryl-undecaprenol N-acetylglucosamine transferase